MNKQERERMRESIAENNTCWRTSYLHPDIVLALLDHIDALEGQIEGAYFEGYQCGWDESNEGYKAVAREAWNKSKAKENSE